MIFVTVGSSEPFDRLIRAVDEWALLSGSRDVFAQAGQTSYVPRYIEIVQFLTPTEFRRCVSASRLVVAHAGVGAIATALEARKPLIVMPRSARLGEHVNEHQRATVARLARRFGIVIAKDESDLVTRLNEREFRPANVALEVSPQLISTIRTFIAQ